mgnify:CR=1 FL=1
MKLDGILELLLSPNWRELWLGPETLGAWVDENEKVPGSCPFTRTFEVTLGEDLWELIPALQIHLKQGCYNLWQESGLPINPNFTLHGCSEGSPTDFSVIWGQHLACAGTLKRGQLLALHSRPGSLQDTFVEQLYGLPARWISPNMRTQAERSGFTILDNLSLIATSVIVSIRRLGARLLEPVQVQELLELWACRRPKTVALARRRVPFDELLWVLQGLLDEDISIRDLDLILNVLIQRPPHPLAAVRLAMSPTFCEHTQAPGQPLDAVTIHPRLERSLAERHPATISTFLSQLNEEAKRLGGEFRVLVCKAEHRFWLRRLLKPIYPQLAVFSWDELTRVGVNSIALLGSSRRKTGFKADQMSRSLRERSPRAFFPADLEGD